MTMCGSRAASIDNADEGRAVTSFEVAATGDASSSTVVQLAHKQDQDCGGHILQVEIACHAFRMAPGVAA